jgi:hypothetical protein
VTHIANRSWMRRGVLAALVLLAVSMGAPGARAAPVAGPASAPALLEPKALELLKAASARLAGSHSMSFTATVSYESPSALGPALVYSTQSEVTMQRPDRLRVITPGDGPATEFYYDGKTMTAYGRAENLVATAAAPSTIDAALEQAFSNAAIYFPFTDLIVADPYKDLAEGLKVAFYIGRSSVVDGTTTDMVAFGNDSVFAQIWIGVDDKLPRKLRAVYLNDPAQLRHDMQLSNWKLDGKVAADAFQPKLAAGATHIAFARPDMMPAGAAARPPMTAPVQPKSADHP